MICIINKAFLGIARVLFDIIGPIIGPYNNNLDTKDILIDRDFKLRIYTPLLCNNQKVILYYHGGGWIIGSIKAYDRIFKFISINTGFALVGVEYRKAPEYKYPQALEDANSAFKWVIENIIKKNRETKIILLGDSAGGNLVNGIINKINVENYKILDQIILIYPAIDLEIKSANLLKKIKPKWLNIIGYIMLNYCLKQYQKNPERIKLNYNNHLKIKNYLEKNRLRITVIMAQWDPLSIFISKWTKKMSALGCNVTCVNYPHTFHGFINFTRLSKQARKALNYIIEVIKR